MKCPDCAEEIKDEAIKCRFCGRAINDADRMGFPSFYNRIQKHGFTLVDHVLSDYADHVQEDGSSRINADSLAGNLFHWGNLDEYELLHGIQVKMFDRVFELYGKKGFDWRGEIPHHGVEKLFSSPDSDELKALYLGARYIKHLEVFGKSWRGEDARKKPDEIKFAISRLTEVVDLAENAIPPMEDYAETVKHNVEELNDVLSKLENFDPGNARKHLIPEKNNNDVHTATSIYSSITRQPDSKSRSKTSFWVFLVIVGLIIIGRML